MTSIGRGVTVLAVTVAALVALIMTEPGDASSIPREQLAIEVNGVVMVVPAGSLILDEIEDGSSGFLVASLQVSLPAQAPGEESALTLEDGTGIYELRPSPSDRETFFAEVPASFDVPEARLGVELRPGFITIIRLEDGRLVEVVTEDD